MFGYRDGHEVLYCDGCHKPIARPDDSPAHKGESPIYANVDQSATRFYTTNGEMSGHVCDADCLDLFANQPMPTYVSPEDLTHREARQHLLAVGLVEEAEAV